MTAISQFVNSMKRIDGIIKRKTEGLNHEDSMRQLPFPGNCMNWNLGHILVYRMQYLGILDGVSKPDPAEFAIYGGGSDPLTDSSKAMPLATLLARLDDATAQVIAALESMPVERLAESRDAEPSATVEARPTFYLSFHESYHAGQMEILHELALAHK